MNMKKVEEIIKKIEMNSREYELCLKLLEIWVFIWILLLQIELFYLYSFFFNYGFIIQFGNIIITNKNLKSEFEIPIQCLFWST